MGMQTIKANTLNSVKRPHSSSSLFSILPLRKSPKQMPPRDTTVHDIKDRIIQAYFESHFGVLGPDPSDASVFLNLIKKESLQPGISRVTP